jgi:DNA-binding NtrC family response regulator
VHEIGEFEMVGSNRKPKKNMRIIAATNADLDQYVRDGRFRPDLLFRINTVEIRMPPLRERIGDIVPLAQAALSSFGRKHARAARGFTPEAIRNLYAYSWPGNVRELRNVVERAVLLARDEYIDSADLRLNAGDSKPPRLEQMSLEDAERALVQAALRRFEGNVAAAAEALGISRSGMYRRMEKLGIRADGRASE